MATCGRLFISEKDKAVVPRRRKRVMKGSRLDTLIGIALVLDVAGGLLLGHAHLGGIRRVRHPLGAGAGVGLLEHLVDLLEGETLGLGHEEVGVDEAAGA